MSLVRKTLMSKFAIAIFATACKLGHISKVSLVSNFAQQLSTTLNNMQQHAAGYAKGRNNFGSCWPTMLRPFARGGLSW